MQSTLDAIGRRYTTLAPKKTCLSCGGAINHAEPRPGEVCVDLGCGRGQDVIRLARAVGREGYVYGIDISQGMVDRARSNIAEAGVHNAAIIDAPIDALPLAESSVDVVISNCTINHAPDKRRVWSEIARILSPGGRFVVSDIYSSVPVPQPYRDDPAAVAECWAGAVTREEYLSTLETCGFVDIDIIEESEPYEKGKILVASITIRGRKSRS